MSGQAISPSVFPQGCSQSISTRPVFVLGIVSIQVQEFALGLVELYEAHTVLPLKPGKVPLGDIPSLQHVHCTAQPGVSKLAEVTLNSTVHFADKGVTQRQPKCQPY